MDYSAFLTDEQKRNVLIVRQQQFAMDAWQHQMNADAATKTGNTDVVDASAAAIVTLDASLAVVADELAKLPVVTV